MVKDNIHTQDDDMIESEFNALIEDYLKTNHRRKIEIITKAFLLAKEAHKGARRRSGEPYIMHPIAVARIVCKEIGLGSTSICAALLHDVVEDTEYTVEDINRLFGEKISKIKVLFLLSDDSTVLFKASCLVSYFSIFKSSRTTVFE